jgi:hypothetical protein
MRAALGQPVTGERRDVARLYGGRRHGRRQAVIRLLIEVVVLAAAALFVLGRLAGNAGQVGTTFDRLHWHWLFVSVLAEVGSIVALSWLQQRLLRVGDVPARVRHLLPVTMASNAVAQSLPAGTLFAEGYAFRQYQRLGAGRAVGLWAELSAGALASAALAAVAVAGAAVVGSGLRLKLLPGLAVILAGALVAAALFRQVPLLSDFIARLLRRAERRLPERFCRPLRSAEEATRQMESFRPSVRVWAMCFAAAALNWGMDAVVLLMGLLTVGGPVPWRGVLLCYASAQLLVELPVTPGGLGLVEGGLVEVMTRFGVPVSKATAGTLMYRVVSYWLLLLVGWLAVLWLTLRNRRADRAHVPTPARNPG